MEWTEERWFSLPAKIRVMLLARYYPPKNYIDDKNFFPWNEISDIDGKIELLEIEEEKPAR